MAPKASAPGKLILSGEYAVVFGYPGIAVPSALGMTAEWDVVDGKSLTVHLQEDLNSDPWKKYVDRIIELYAQESGRAFTGKLTLSSTLPLGRGMGSSTAAVIAIGQALLGPDCEAEARTVEDAINPGHSGLDFAVIWQNRPLLFQKGRDPHALDLPTPWLKNAELIDTGAPNETTAELVAWVKSRQDEPDVQTALKTIGQCTERLLAGESPFLVFPDHNTAQIALGIVPPHVQDLIAGIEAEGGVAKVVGAGGRTGGGGMVLALKTPLPAGEAG